MVERRSRPRFEPRVPGLERRELLAYGGVHPPATAVGLPGTIRPDNPLAQPPQHPLFHHNGINGVTLHKHFVNRMNDRLNVSKDQTIRISQAFQAFAQNVFGIPASIPGGLSGGTAGTVPTQGISANPGPGGQTGTTGGQTNRPAITGGLPIGQIPNPPTLSNFLDQLDTQVAFAISTEEVQTNRIQPSVSGGIHTSPMANLALVPYAQQQIAQLRQFLMANPPTFDVNGVLADQGQVKALNTAFNNIMNALAESSLHPRLFTHPSDFYINPAVNYTITFASTPAKQGPGFFVLGPGGKVLPGAVLHPYLKGGTGV